MTIYQLLFNRLTLFVIHFSVSSACPVGCAVCYPIGVFSVAENISIKNNKLCKTNPISEKPKMVVTLVITMTNNNKQRTMNYSKQTQSNPILSAVLSGVALAKTEALTKADSKGILTQVRQV